MQPPSALLAALCLASCAGANASLDAGSASRAEDGPSERTVAAWLAGHDEVRARAVPAPDPPLPPLTWNGQAAAVAGAWAARCAFEHNASRGDYGENLAASTDALTPAAALAMWAAEAKDYDYAGNGCSGTCGHYTQVVWRDTTSVGCAIQRCTSGSPFSTGTWYFAVCNYSPPGNYVGRKPY